MDDEYFECARRVMKISKRKLLGRTSEAEIPMEKSGQKQKVRRQPRSLHQESFDTYNFAIIYNRATKVAMKHPDSYIDIDHENKILYVRKNRPFH